MNKFWKLYDIWKYTEIEPDEFKLLSTLAPNN